MPLSECQKSDDVSIHFNTVPVLNRHTDRLRDRRTDRRNW